MSSSLENTAEKGLVRLLQTTNATTTASINDLQQCALSVLYTFRNHSNVQRRPCIVYYPSNPLSPSVSSSSLKLSSNNNNTVIGTASPVGFRVRLFASFEVTIDFRRCARRRARNLSRFRDERANARKRKDRKDRSPNLKSPNTERSDRATMAKANINSIKAYVQINEQQRQQRQPQ